MQYYLIYFDDSCWVGTTCCFKCALNFSCNVTKYVIAIHDLLCGSFLNCRDILTLCICFNRRYIEGLWRLPSSLGYGSEESQGKLFVLNNRIASGLWRYLFANFISHHQMHKCGNPHRCWQRMLIHRLSPSNLIWEHGISYILALHRRNLLCHRANAMSDGPN